MQNALRYWAIDGFGGFHRSGSGQAGLIYEACTAVSNDDI